MESQTAYEQLANQDEELLIWLKTRMSEGVTAETVANWAPWRYANLETVALVTGAARYIERAGKAEEDTASYEVTISRRNCEWCGGRVEIGADYKRCLNCGRHQ